MEIFQKSFFIIKTVTLNKCVLKKIRIYIFVVFIHRHFSVVFSQLVFIFILHKSHTLQVCRLFAWINFSSICIYITKKSHCKNVLFLFTRKIFLKCLIYFQKNVTLQCTFFNSQMFFFDFIFLLQKFTLYKFDIFSLKLISEIFS